MNTQIVRAAAVLSACLMASLLLKTPHTFLVFVLLATPYTMVLGAWMSFRGVVGRLATEGQSDPMGRIEMSITTLALTATLGIATALAVGFSLGHMSAH